MKNYINFERGRDDADILTLGPFEFIQVTYNLLRVGPDGKIVASYNDNDWHVDPGFGDDRIIAYGGPLDFSDFIVYSKD